MNRIYFRPLIVALVLLTPVAAFARQDDTEAAPVKTRPKAQSVLASKTATFGTVAASDPLLKKATDATKLAEVKKLLDTDAAIVGTVVAVFAPKSNKIVMLNFAEEHWTAATVAVKGRNFAKFPALKTLVGKKVLVSGHVSDFDDKPQIEVAEPSQIKIVKE